MTKAMKAAPKEKIIGERCPNSGAAYKTPLSNGISINSTKVPHAPSKILGSAKVAFIAAGADINGAAAGGADAGGAEAILTMVKDKRLMNQEDGYPLIF